MSVVTYFVETSQGYLDTAAETQFGVGRGDGRHAPGSGHNARGDPRLPQHDLPVPGDGRAHGLLARGQDRAHRDIRDQLGAVQRALLRHPRAGSTASRARLSLRSVAARPGPSGTFAEEFDRLIAELGDYLNAAGSELNWMAGAMLDIVGVLLLSILGGLAAFILVASRLMIALLIGIAPVMIFLTLFEVTKDYFARWLSALISFAIYPIVVAGVFATITGVSSALIGELGDPEGASNIGALIPFFMMVLMAKGFIIATPFIVRAISGNIMMPALSAVSAAATALPAPPWAASRPTIAT